MKRGLDEDWGWRGWAGKELGYGGVVTVEGAQDGSLEMDKDVGIQLGKGEDVIEVERMEEKRET